MEKIAYKGTEVSNASFAAQLGYVTSADAISLYLEKYSGFFRT